VEGCANFGTAGARATALNNVASTGAFARAGGIVGFNFGTILDGVNKGLVVAEAEVANNYVYVIGDDVPRAEAYSGGISGTNWEGSLVKRCHNSGEVNGRTLPISAPGCWSDGFLYVGGISGLSFAAIEDCSNAGVVNAEGKNDTHVLAAGGIVGCMDHVDAITVNCYNAGSVTADQRASGAYGWIDGVGGIAGHVFDGNIFNCYNKGNLALTSNSGFLDVGGIIGSMWPDGFADACYWYVGAVQTAGVFPMPLGVGYVSNTLGAVTISFDNTELEDLLGWLNGYVETYAPTTLSGWVIIPGLNNDFPIFGNIVTFDPDNGDPEWDVSVGYGGIVDEPSPEPTKYGYDFLGWFTVSDDQWDFDDPVFNDMTLTAKWQPVQWTVTFDPDNGELSFYEMVDHGSSVTEPSDPTKTGYIFFGWFTFFDDKWNFSDPVGSSMTLKAKWIIDSGAWATVTFDSNGGSAVAAVDVIKGDTITAPTAPTKATYIFGGWYSDIALTTAFTFTTPISGDMTLYAKWNYDPADWATVTFDSLGGSAVPAEYVLKGGTATEPAAPTKDWWVFEWWCTDPECEEDYTWDPVDADITLYAKWRRGNEGWAVVTFESNGGSDVPEQYVLQGDLCTKPGDPYKLGWELDAWYSDEGLTVEFDFDTPVDGDITLYAKWSINPEAWATVTFVSNGGTPVPSASVLKGELVPRPASPTRASFTFDKWYTDEAFEQEFSFDTPVDSDLTLYAKYTPVPVVVAEEGGFNWLLLLIPLALLLILFLLWMRPSVYGTITYNGEGVSDVTIEYTIKKKNSEETISKQAVNKKSGKYRIIVSMGAEFTFTVIAKDGHTVSEIPATFVIEKRSTEVNFTVK